MIERKNTATVKKTFTLLGKACGGATSGIAVISDVLSPIAPFSLYFGIAAFLGLIFMLISVSIPAISSKFKTWLGDYWAAPAILAVGISTTMLFGTYSLGTKSQGGGYLSSKVPIVARMQDDMGIMREKLEEIAEDTGRIADNTDTLVETTGAISETTAKIAKTNEAVAESTKEIAVNTDAIKEVVKKETSDDPRKELMNMGIEWSALSFVNSMKEGDLRAVSLFLDGGMKATTTHKGSSALLFALQDNLGNDPVALLELFVQKGFDLDTPLKDTIIMANRTNDNLPFAYEAKHKPAGYGEGDLYGKTFVGSILLWEVMINMYKAPTKDNLDVIEYLCKKGVDKSYVFAFLDSKMIQSLYFDGSNYSTSHLPVMKIIGYKK